MDLTGALLLGLLGLTFIGVMWVGVSGTKRDEQERREALRALRYCAVRHDSLEEATPGLEGEFRGYPCTARWIEPDDRYDETKVEFEILLPETTPGPIQFEPNSDLVAWITSGGEEASAVELFSFDGIQDAWVEQRLTEPDFEQALLDLSEWCETHDARSFGAHDGFLHVTAEVDNEIVLEPEETLDRMVAFADALREDDESEARQLA